MTALDLLKQLHRLGVALTPSPDGKIRCRVRKGVLSDELLDAMRQHKQVLLAVLAPPAPVHEAPAPAPRTEACAHEEHFPPTVTDGPLRQCAACPHGWSV